ENIFSNTSKFTFIITGDFPQNEIIRLIRKYLGNLPAKTKMISCITNIAVDYSIPEGPLHKTYSNKSESLGRNNIKYSLRFIAKKKEIISWKDLIKVRIMSNLLKSKVMELRYKYNENIYITGAGCILDKEGLYYSFYFDVDCEPKDLKKIKKRIDTVIEEIKNESFSQAHITNEISRSILPSLQAGQN